MSPAASGTDLPLRGVKVLDLTRLLPGPVCTLHLADLGAEVTKVEDTGAGDYARTLGAKPGAVSAFYRMVNRGKRSIALDLKDARGREAFLALARRADVVVEGFRPGVVDALGVGYDAVRAVRPSIVYASISGYGQDGPRARYAGHDVNYLGYAGVLDQTGARGGPPALSNLQVADLLGGALTTALAIVAALAGALRSGHGRRIDVAMADAALAHNVFALHALVQDGRVAPRGEDLLTGGVPCYGVYPTRDGRWLAVGALEAKFWRRCARRSAATTWSAGISPPGRTATACAPRSKPRSGRARCASGSPRSTASMPASPRCCRSTSRWPIRSSRREA